MTTAAMKSEYFSRPIPITFRLTTRLINSPSTFISDLVSMIGVEKRVNKPEALKGVMIGGPSGQANDYLIAFGATPVSTTEGETYEAILLLSKLGFLKTLYFGHL
jgi:hypothetical protein